MLRIRCGRCGCGFRCAFFAGFEESHFGSLSGAVLFDEIVFFGIVSARCPVFSFWGLYAEEDGYLNARW